MHFVSENSEEPTLVKLIDPSKGFLETDKFLLKFIFLVAGILGWLKQFDKEE